MPVRFHPHALDRMAERGATEDEARIAIDQGRQVPVKLGRISFRRDFPFNSHWRGRYYETKQVEVFAVQEGSDWLVISVITRFF